MEKVYITTANQVRVIVDRQYSDNIFKMKWRKITAADICCSSIKISTVEPDFNSKLNVIYDMAFTITINKGKNYVILYGNYC